MSRVPNRWKRTALWVLALLVFGFLLGREQGIIGDLGRTAVTAKRTAAETRRISTQAQLEALRSCIRANINAAIVKITATGPENSDPAFERLADTLYPILDCKRSQLTRSSIPLDKAQVAKYIDVVVSARFPIVKDGSVVGSRGSLLEGVDSLQEAGSVP